MAESSLQQLLALDKKFEDIDSRIDEAARILGLPPHAAAAAGTQESDDSDTPLRLILDDSARPEASASHSARHEFVLRWLLDKIRTQPAARQSPAVWSLLRRVVNQIRPAVLPRSLVGSNLVLQATAALTEKYPVEDVLEHIHVHAPAPHSSEKASKKRKRNGQLKNTAQEDDQGPVLFIQIASTLQSVLRLAGGGPLQSQICSVFRVEDNDLVNFAKQWLSAMLSLVGRAPSVPSVEASTCMKMLVDIWNLQPSTRASAKPALSNLFCQESLWPASLLLSVLSSKGSALSDSRKPLELLERLLAQQLFVPARTQADAAADAIQVSKSSSDHASSTASAALGSRLEALGKHMSELQSDATLHTAQAALPLLLDIAIRCTPLSTPKRRVAEGPWIDSVFAALVKTLGPAAVSTSRNSTLVEMLSVLGTRGLHLGSDLMSGLVDDWCRLPVPHSTHIDPPNFELIAKVIAMSPTLFTDSSALRTSALFDAMTTYGRTQQSAPVSAHLPPATQTGAMPDQIRSSVAIPLLKAFARVRSLDHFLDAWLAQLKTHPEWKTLDWFIWTDDELQAALADVLETSHTAMQIRNLVSSAGQTLVAYCAVDKDSKPSREIEDDLAANTVLLNAYVGALRTDVTLDQLFPTFELLTSSAQRVMDRVSPESPHLLGSLFLLLSRLHILCFPRWSAGHSQEEAGVMALDMLDSSSVSLATEYIAKARKRDTLTPQQTRCIGDGIVLLSTVCDLTRRISNAQDRISKLMAVITSVLEKPHSVEAGLIGRLCATMVKYPALLEYTTQTHRQQILRDASLALLQPHGQGASLVQATAPEIGSETRDDLYSTIIASAETASTDLLSEVSANGGLQRQQRERTLDLIVGSAVALGDEDTGELAKKLSQIINLLELPNATSRLATDPAVVWQLASVVSAQTSYEHNTVEMLETLCERLFDHILDNKDQDRSQKFLQGLATIIARFMAEKQTFALTAGQVRLSVSFLRSTEARLDYSTLAVLPHRTPGAVDAFVKNLWKVLSDGLEDDAPSEGSVAGMVVVTHALVHIPQSFLSCGGSSTEKYMKRFAKLALKQLDDSSQQSTSPTSIPNQILLLLLSHSASGIATDDASKLCTITERLLALESSVRRHHQILQIFGSAIQDIPEDRKLAIANELLSESQLSVENATLAKAVIVSFHSTAKHSAIPGTTVLLPHVLALLGRCSTYRLYRQLCDCLITMLRDKPNLVTQYSAEQTIALMTLLVSSSSPSLDQNHGPAIFESICTTTQSLMQFHRSSLGGRFHLFVPLLERLIACLFCPGGRDAGTLNRFKHPTWLDTRHQPLSTKHAQHVSRLLEHCCNPPQANNSVRRKTDATKGPDLVDESRKARLQVGQHAQYLLHTFCSLTLHGRLGEGMRDALMPGLWAILDVMEMTGDESRGIKALSAACAMSDRAVLRGIVQDWRRFGAWSG